MDSQSIRPEPSEPKNGLDCNNSFENVTSAPVNAKEYAAAVRTWIWQYHMWNQMNMMSSMMPFHAMSCMNGQNMRLNNLQPPASPYIAHQIPQQNDVNRRPAVRQQTDQAPQQFASIDYKIPSIWKRLFAEFIDFLLLFIVKLGATMIAIDKFGYTNLERYDLDYMMLLSSEEVDPEKILSLMNELIAVEVLNRIFVIIFETFCLHRGMVNEIGGQTPGKRIAGIRVVSCDHVLELPNSVIRVVPNGNIGIWNALVRSTIKNFSMAFFFPVCFTSLFFQHKRSAYDLLSSSMVVEDIPIPRRRR
ncbi:unnamed protein product [Owenia fusiformis]|uniref:RDD domain-containing protein n=1 Tax=Owenia fusiformis TaxID=6347 RepID=A0A8J1Y0F9_OWEFU|nr:unnamed protein product [Owenia fusiformis]